MRPFVSRKYLAHIGISEIVDHELFGSVRAMDRAFSSLRVRTISEDQRIIEGIATTPRLDRASDIVESSGAEFDLPIPFLLDHDHTQAVGEVEAAEVSPAGIRFRARIRKITEAGAAKDLTDRAWSLVKNGLRRFVSIGFRAADYEPLANGGLRYTRWEWLELSAVAIPANPDAAIQGVRSARSRGGRPVALHDRPVSLYEIANGAIPGRKLTEHERKLVAMMRRELIASAGRQLDKEIARRAAGLPAPNLVYSLKEGRMVPASHRRVKL